MNQINKIHYCVTITTKSDKTSPSIGFYDGMFRYVSDNFDMSGVTDGDGGDGFDTAWEWNTDLLNTNGIKGLSSQIDIVAGGDYSFLSNSTIELINKTSIGNTVHKTINDLSDVTVLGADMKIYVIIDGVAYTRWTGMVTAKSFNENTFSFMGSDKLTNSTNILENTIIGMINADVTYNPLGDIKMDNITSYRFNDINKHVKKISTLRSTGIDGTFDIFEDEFNGLGVGSHGYVYDKGSQISIQMFMGDSTVGIEEGDYIKFVEDGSFRRIIGTSYATIGDGLRTITLRISSLLPKMEYSFLFGDPTDEFTGGIHTTLETLSSKDDGELCYFQIYSKSIDTGINGENIQPDIAGNYSLTVLHNGSEFTFSASKNADGNMIIRQETSLWTAKPVKIKYFHSNKEEFKSKVMSERGDFEDFLSNGSYVDLQNELDTPSSTIGDMYSEFSRYHYFNLTFKRSDLEGKEGLKIGTVISGMLDGQDRQAWKTLNEYPLKDREWYYDDALSDVSYERYTGDSWARYAFRGQQSRYWALTMYNVIKDNRFGRQPISFERELIPNVMEPQYVVYTHRPLDPEVDDWHHRFQTQVSSRPITNVPFQDTSNVINVKDGAIYVQDETNYNWYMNQTSEDLTDEMEIKYYVEDGAEYADVLISISTRQNGSQDIGFQDSEGNQTLTQMSDEYASCMFKTNGFFAYDICQVNQAEIDLTLMNNVDSDSDNYLHLLDTVSINGDLTMVSNRDEWQAGLVIDEPKQRYNIITDICKQGFVTGFTNRFGVDVYKTFLSDSDTPIIINNSNTIRDSIKQFKSTPVSKVYNEFNITGDGIKSISITKIDEDSFPLEDDDDWKTYVTGVDDYEKAKSFWNKAHTAFEITNVIHKLPADRAKLQFAQSSSIDLPLTSDDYESIIWTNEALLEVGEPAYIDDPVIFNLISVGDVVNFISIYDVNDFVEARCVDIVYQNPGNDILVFDVLAINSLSQRFNFQGNLSYSSNAKTQEISTYRDEYLDLLLDWTTYPKLQVNCQLPITSDTVKYEIMDEVHFNDYVVTPDIGEYGKGWVTSLSFDVKNSIINCTITFEPAFFIIPRYSTPI